MGTPASGTDNFVVHQREVTVVSYMTSNEEREESPEERTERERIIYESILRSEGETTPVDDDMGVDGFGGTQARSTTVVTPIVQTSQLPPGADLPINPEDVAWGALEGEADESQIILQQLITMLQRNATNMNPVDITEARRTLEQSASKGSAAAITALRI